MERANQRRGPTLTRWLNQRISVLCIWQITAASCSESLSQYGLLGLQIVRVIPSFVITYLVVFHVFMATTNNRLTTVDDDSMSGYRWQCGFRMHSVTIWSPHIHSFVAPSRVASLHSPQRLTSFVCSSSVSLSLCIMSTVTLSLCVSYYQTFHSLTFLCVVSLWLLSLCLFVCFSCSSLSSVSVSCVLADL